MRNSPSVTLADFLAAGHRARPSEAAALVLELVTALRPGKAASVSPPVAADTILLDPVRGASMAGQVLEDEQSVSLLGHLLARLLDLAGEDEGVKIPARLRRLSLRAARTLPGTPNPLTVRDLSSALRRYAPKDTRGTVLRMVERWQVEGSAGVGKARVSSRAEAWRRAWPVLWQASLASRWRVPAFRRRKEMPLDSAF
jgi:hypothetical protein